MMASLSLPVVLLVLSCLSPLTSSKPVDSFCFSMQGKTSGEDVEPPGSCDVPNNASISLTHNETHVNLTHRVDTDFCRSNDSCYSLDMVVKLTLLRASTTLNLVKHGFLKTPLKDWPNEAPELKDGGKADVSNQFAVHQQVDGKYISITYTVSRKITLQNVTTDLLDDEPSLVISLNRQLMITGADGIPQASTELHHAGKVEKHIPPTPSPRDGQTGWGSSTMIYVVIGVVVLIAAVLVVLLLVYLFRRRR